MSFSRTEYRHDVDHVNARDRTIIKKYFEMKHGTNRLLPVALISINLRRTNAVRHHSRYFTRDSTQPRLSY